MITVTPFIRSFHVSFSPLKDLDMVGYKVHAVPAAQMVNGDFIPTGDNPPEGNLIYEGPSTFCSYVLPEGIKAGTWYVKVCGYDTFGEDVLNYSSPIGVLVEDLQIMPDELFSTARTDFYLRDATFLFGDIDPITGAITNATRLSWDAGFIDRADKTYILTPGTLADGSDSYIIATLTEGSPGTATIRQSAFGSGLPEIETTEIILAVTSTEPLSGTNNYVAYVRQANSAMFEGAYIRNATIGDAKLYGTLSANRITTLHGGVVINDHGITVTNIISSADAAAAAAATASEDSIAAAATASAAQDTANSANTALLNIASDNILSPSEKPSVVQDYSVIITEKTALDTQATAFSITTEKTAYDSAVTALTTYLGTLSGWNTVPGDDVAIVGTTFRSNFASVYTTKQTLLNAIAAKAKALADAAAAAASTAQGTANSAESTASTAYSTAVTAFNATGKWDKSGYPTFIDGTKIYTQDAYVGSLQIQGNAITVPYFLSFAASISFDATDPANTYYYLGPAIISMPSPPASGGMGFYITGFVKLLAYSGVANWSLAFKYSTINSPTGGTEVTSTIHNTTMIVGTTVVQPISAYIPITAAGTYYVWPSIKRDAANSYGLIGSCCVMGAKR